MKPDHTLVFELYSDGNGDDVISGGAGRDLAYGGPGMDLINGDSNNDILYGGADNDVIYSDQGDDRLFGDTGAGTLFGNSGNDVMSGGPGVDSIQGGSGYDRVTGDAELDAILGAELIQGVPDMIVRMYATAGQQRLISGLGSPIRPISLAPYTGMQLAGLLSMDNQDEELFLTVYRPGQIDQGIPVGTTMHNPMRESSNTVRKRINSQPSTKDSRQIIKTAETPSPQAEALSGAIKSLSTGPVTVESIDETSEGTAPESQPKVKGRYPSWKNPRATMKIMASPPHGSPADNIKRTPSRSLETAPETMDTHQVQGNSPQGETTEPGSE